MKLAKNYKVGYEWKQMELTSIEMHQARDELRKENKAIMKKCMDDAEEILRERKCMVGTEKTLKLATALFNKLATQSFTAYQATLDELIALERAEGVKK